MRGINTQFERYDGILVEDRVQQVETTKGSAVEERSGTVQGELYRALEDAGLNVL